MILIKKSIHDIKRNKSAFLAIFLVIFLGNFIYSGLNATWNGMLYHTNTFYKDTNTADLWISGKLDHVERIVKDIQKIKGVSQIEKRLHMKTHDLAKNGGDLEVNFLEDQKISKSIIKQGEAFSPEKEGIWIDQFYAKHHHYSVGDTITVSLFGENKRFKIKGLIINPEYIYYLGSSENLLPDYKEDGYAVVSHGKNLPAKQKVYNQILVTCASPQKNSGFSNKKEVVDSIMNRLKGRDDLEKCVILDREHNASFRLTQDKIEQFKAVSTLFPSLFFIIAMLIMAISMTRLLKEQAYEIGILQALGFKGKQLMWHYLSYGVLIALPASVLGYVLGQEFFPPYIFKAIYMYKINTLGGLLPNKNLFIILISCIISVFSIYIAVKYSLDSDIVANLKKSRNRKNKKHRLDSVLKRIENTKFWGRRSFEQKWILKHSKDYLIRTFTMIFTVCACMILTVSALDIKDSVLDINPWHFEEINTYKHKMILKDNLSEAEIKKLADKNHARTLFETNVELKIGSKKIIKSSRIMEKDNPFIHLKDTKKKQIPLTDKGIFISSRFSQTENIHLNDKIKFRNIGENTWKETKVAGIYRQPINQGITMSKKFYVDSGYAYKPTSLISTKEVRITKDPNIVRVIDTQSEKKNINKMIHSLLAIVFLMIIGSVVLMTIVLFNLGSLNILENKTNFRVLKLLGFRDRLIRKMFTKETLMNTIIGMIIGLLFSKILTVQILSSMGSSTDMMYLGKPGTKGMAFFIVFILSIMINTILSTKINRIDLVKE